MEESKWISVKEKRKPKENTEVLVFAPNCEIIGSILIGCYYKSTKSNRESWTVYDFGRSKLGEKVTHWMPLPSPPDHSKNK